MEPANNMTRNTNSPQRGAETLRLVKTRLSSFCAASEKDLGRWTGLVSVGSAVRSWQSPDLYSSTECPRLLTDPVISSEPEVTYQGQSVGRSLMLPSHWEPPKTTNPLQGGLQGQFGGVCENQHCVGTLRSSGSLELCQGLDSP